MGILSLLRTEFVTFFDWLLC